MCKFCTRSTDCFGLQAIRRLSTGTPPCRATVPDITVATAAQSTHQPGAKIERNKYLRKKTVQLRTFQSYPCKELQWWSFPSQNPRSIAVAPGLLKQMPKPKLPLTRQPKWQNSSTATGRSTSLANIRGGEKSEEIYSFGFPQQVCPQCSARQVPQPHSD